MPYKVLVVDDSNFFQNRLKEIINEHPELEVVGIAANGREAIDKADSLKPDLITMDYEMPVLNGVVAVKEIMAKRPVPILMFSSMTFEGARITLDALAAGAVDFITKDFGEVSRNSAALKKRLHQRLLDIVKNQRVSRSIPAPKNDSSSSEVKSPPRAAVASNLRNKVDIVVIGASTGGPVAVTDVLTKLPSNFPVPIIVVQHMPENFTKAFAERLDKQCQVSVKEAEDGDRLSPGAVLLAPGGKQLMIDAQQRGSVKVLPGDERVNYRPSVDITFGSAANSSGAKTLAIILTGMGADGCEGARLLKGKGAIVWSQDEASCIIYGMPMAVAKANLTDSVISLSEIGPKLAQAFR
ncbi:chemotaxis response regulator protein-glutamate methylesterase [Aurantivibrio plasticivorans]